jgi:hypothetical protein
VDEPKSRKSRRNEGGPVHSGPVVDDARSNGVAKDALSAPRDQGHHQSRDPATDTVTFCGNPARVREGFALALGALEACSDLLLLGGPAADCDRNDG